jgi:HEAT repeat protein
MLLASDDMRADPSAQIVAAMARIADPAAADVLLKYVETRQAGGAELADALGATCDPRCVGPLLDLMEEAYDGDYGMLVQQAGVRGLANIGAAAVSPLAQEYPRRRDFVKRNIATALGKIGGDEAQELLATYLEGEASYEAAAALDRLGDPRGAAYIRDELERLLNADEPVPVELYYALEQCQGESLHAICLRLIDSPVFSARWAAAESLARQGDEVGWRFFRTRLEDDEQASRAIYALARLGDAASTKDIARLARHRQQDIVQASIHALAQLQNREAALALLNLGQGPRTVRGYAELRRDSVRALAAYPAQEVMNVVVELLDDDDERVVHFAYMALSEIAGDNLVDAEHWRRWWAYHRSDYSPQVPTDVSANKSAW